jgi:predicted ATPase
VFAVPSLSARDGVALFLARARQLGAEPAADGGVEELCERLDELPLALELAAARTLLFSPRQLLERLVQRLDLLQGERDADPRQRTLRATIEWSYDLLQEPEQVVFRRLAVFVGGCTYEAAETVCGAGPDELQSLLDKSLLRRRDTDEGPRYWVLETMREFAAERLLASGELDALRKAHARYFVGRADERDIRRFSIVDEEGLAWLSSERENVHAAVAWAVERGDDALFAVAARALCSWWLYSGWGRQGLHRIECVLTRREQLEPFPKQIESPASRPPCEMPQESCRTVRNGSGALRSSRTGSRWKMRSSRRSAA